MRILRKWNAYQKAIPTELFCVSMVLIDAEGNKIQASVLNKSMHAQFCVEYHEGDILELENFIVSKNNYKYRATNHPFKISLTTQTSIFREHASIPSVSYSFIPISDLLKLDDNDHTDYLFDVIAFATFIGTLEDAGKDGVTKYRLRMVLTDMERNDIECVLWDSCASDASIAQMQNHDTPVVAVINLARLGWAESNTRQISSSFEATRVLFNPQIKEVTQLIQSGKEFETPVTTTFSQALPSQMSQRYGERSLHNLPKVAIADIPSQEKDNYFAVSCKIIKFQTKYGWKYDTYKKDNVKLKLQDEHDPTSPMICPVCQKTPATTNTKVKVHYIVTDDNGELSVIFWDKLALQLVERTLLQLNESIKESLKKKKKNPIPKEFESPVGKNLLIKVKNNDYNKNHPGSCLSVSEFAFCEDLLPLFDSASSNVPTQDNTQSGRNASPETPPTQSLDDDEQPIIQIEKAKKNMYSKRVLSDDEPPIASHSSSNAPPTARLLKAIKIEK